MTDLLCVVGPTASGKTGLSIELALRYGGEVVSCDSMQVYRGMDIGTAKPSAEERRGVPHHMLDVVPPDFAYSAGQYAKQADACVRDILERGKLPIVCGGTGLYLKALCGGMADLPDCPRLDHGPDAYERLCQVDPEAAARLLPRDQKRIGRALDVYCATGIPLSEHQRQTAPPSYRPRCVGIGLERQELYARIDRRADDMLAHGLVEEVRALLAGGLSRGATSMQALGYKEVAAYLDGQASLEAAALRIKQGTRRYAKRQMTWFSRQNDVYWIKGNFFNNVNIFVENIFHI